MPAEYNYRTKAEHEKVGTGYYFEGEQPIEEPGHELLPRATATPCFTRTRSTGAAPR